MPSYPNMGTGTSKDVFNLHAIGGLTHSEVMPGIEPGSPDPKSSPQSLCHRGGIVSYATLCTHVLTLHISLSQMPKNPVKVGGSRPCLILVIDVSSSLPAGSVFTYSYNRKHTSLDLTLSIFIAKWITKC